MYCSQCGTQVSDESVFCYQCGAKIPRMGRQDEGATALTGPALPQTASAPARPGYCERCGQELGVNEKMRGLKIHEHCPVQVEVPPLETPGLERAEPPGPAPTASVHATEVPPGVRPGYCERCGRELGVNEKMRQLTVHEVCPAPALEGPAAAPPAEKPEVQTGPPAAPPAPQVETTRTRAGYCQRCGQELGVDEKMRGLSAHQRCPAPATEAPPGVPAARGEVKANAVPTVAVWAGGVNERIFDHVPVGLMKKRVVEAAKLTKKHGLSPDTITPYWSGFKFAESAMRIAVGRIAAKMGGTSGRLLVQPAADGQGSLVRFEWSKASPSSTPEAANKTCREVMEYFWGNLESVLHSEGVRLGPRSTSLMVGTASILVLALLAFIATIHNVSKMQELHGMTSWERRIHDYPIEAEAYFGSAAVANGLLLILALLSGVLALQRRHWMPCHALVGAFGFVIITDILLGLVVYGEPWTPIQLAALALAATAFICVRKSREDFA